MAADVVVSRELKSLQEELSAVHRERSEVLAVPPAALPGATLVNESAEERELRNQLGELVNEVTRFFEEAEKNISAHPTQSVIGAMVVGILIGRLLGRH